MCIGVFVILVDSCPLYAGTVAALSVTVKNISNNQSTNGYIGWSSVTNDGNTKWRRADQYLEIHYRCNYQVWGMQIFTDNVPKVPADVPPYPFTAKYVWALPEMPADKQAEIKNKIAGDFAAGLVHEMGKQTLPMCWRVIGPRDPGTKNPNGEDAFTLAEQDFELSIEEVADADPSTGWYHLRREGDPPDDYYCWIHMKDMAMDGWSKPEKFVNPITGSVTWSANSSIKWSDGNQYQTVANSQGIHHEEGPDGFAGWGINKALDGQNDSVYGSDGKKYYLYGIIVYLGAKFEKVAGGYYKTKIYVEMYHY